MSIRLSRAAVASCLGFALCLSAHAQSAATDAAGSIAAHQIPRLQGEIVVDGQLDDAAWANALVVDLPYEIAPGDNIAPPQKTTARIAHDDMALYVAFHAEDTDPGQIRAMLRDRDAAFNDDFVGVFLDTFDDGRRAYEFFINPLGVQMDLIKDEASGNEDSSWDGLWSSAGKITAGGYDVEVRIPFSTLRFRNGAGTKRWALALYRNYPRSKRHQLLSSQVKRGSNCLVCTFEKYEGMQGVHQGRNLEVVPSLVMGASQSRTRAGTQWGANATSIEPGLDVSWAPSPNMTLNGTINPDFSQVESDQLQLSINDSFALFFPEKRPFFMEGADYFTTQYDVLYTRQIANPEFGLRITGRTGSGAYGAFVARDAVTQVLVPGVLGSGFRTLDQKANVAVARYRHDLNANTSIGMIGTFRHGSDYGNDVFGIDGRWRQGAHTVTAQFLRSQSQYPQSIVDAYRSELGDDATPIGNAFRAYYNYESRNWSANIGHMHVDPGFRADLGFIGQVGYRKSVIGGGHVWFRDGKAINRINFYSDWDITHRYDGQLLEREIEARLSFQGPKQSQFGIAPLARVRYWRGAMFNEHNLNLFGNYFWRPGIKVGTYMNFGRQLDLTASRTGRRALLGLWFDAALGRSVNLNVEVNRQRLYRDGGTAFEATVANATGSWQLDTRQRLRITLQGSEVLRDRALYVRPVNATSRDWAAQLVYSYKVNPHTALYAGTSYGAFMNDANQELFGNTRNVFVKFSYGWQP